MPRIDIKPRCAEGREIFVSAQADLMPCCHAHRLMRQTMSDPARFEPDDFWFALNRDLFDMNARSPAEIMADPRWAELAEAWTNGHAPRVCFRRCGVPENSGFTTVDEVAKRDRAVLKFGRWDKR